MWRRREGSCKKYVHRMDNGAEMPSMLGKNKILCGMESAYSLDISKRCLSKVYLSLEGQAYPTHCP